MTQAQNIPRVEKSSFTEITFPRRHVECHLEDHGTFLKRHEIWLLEDPKYRSDLSTRIWKNGARRE